MAIHLECKRRKSRKRGGPFGYRPSLALAVALVTATRPRTSLASSSYGPADYYAANDPSLSYRSSAPNRDPAEEDWFLDENERGRSPPPPPPPPRSFQGPPPETSRGRVPPSVSGSSPFSSSSSSSPSTASGYNPIHYEFKARRPDEDEENDRRDDYGGRLPRRSGQQPPPSSPDDTASARRDVVTRYMSSSPSRALYLRLNAAMVGAALGTFLSKSLFSTNKKPSTPLGLVPLMCAVTFVVVSYFRNPYGELVRALGMTLILVLQQSRSIRRRYPSLRHVRSSLYLAERIPFPPSRNPWTYQPRDNYTSDPEFNMLYAVAAMGLVGSFVGSNMPLIPSWMGALIFGSFLAFATTLPNARGDLTRCMGMRVVAVAQETWHLQSELQLLSKAGVVAGKIADKLLILDRKHRIKDRVVSGVSFLYGQIVKATQQQQQRNPNDYNNPADDDADEYYNRNAPPRRPRRSGPSPLDEREGGRRPREMEDEYYRSSEPSERENNDRSRRPPHSRRDDDEGSYRPYQQR